MNAALRAAVAHLAVANVAEPVLDDSSVHHLLRVLRARPGELVTVTDGAGRWRPCHATAGGIEPDGDVVVEDEPSPALTLAVAIPKADRPQWLVRKATEIGIDRIVLLESRRSVVQWKPDKAERTIARLRSIAVEASLQSRRVRFPTVDGPVAACSMLATAAAGEPGNEPLSCADTVVAIGPEGGWDDDELALAARLVGLGDTILRVETAALVATAEMVRLRSARRPGIAP